MFIAMSAAYLAGAIALPLVWDRKHQQGRPAERTAAASGGTMRQRGRTSR